MNRTALTALTLLLFAVPVSAEVSVTRLADGSVELFFEPGPGGPWEGVREGIAEGDRLNPDGDVEGDSWPVTAIHPETGRPDVVWSTGGEDQEIYFSWHDGTAWRAPVNLSETNGADTLPALSNDEHGNRFVVWNRERNSRDLVLVKVLAGDDAAESSPVELSERHDTARRPVIAVHEDGKAYVGYEEGHNGNDPVVYLALDEVVIERDSEGCFSESGERPIDIARSATIVTEATPGDALRPELHVEDGRLWVDWLDGEGQVGWAELVDGAFTAKELVSIEEAGSEQAARDQVRELVLTP